MKVRDFAALEGSPILLNNSAHIIRETSKSFAKSVCALQAERRWAVTGTPIQNRLMDLYSLFKFLQCSPFNDLKVFTTHVTERWKAKSDPDAVAKLKTLVNCISLRRPKTTITLLDRQDEITELEFNEEEQQTYQAVKIKTKHKIDSVGQTTGGATFLNALQWVNELRLICNHGTTSKAIQELEKVDTFERAWSQQDAQAQFDQLDDVGLAKCSNPNCCQDLTSSLSSESDTDHDDEPFINESHELLCFSCHHNRAGRVPGFFKVCNHLPRRSAKRSFEELLPPLSSTLDSSDSPRRESVPTKIQRIVQDLAETRAGIKRFAIYHSTHYRTK